MRFSQKDGRDECQGEDGLRMLMGLKSRRKFHSHSLIPYWTSLGEDQTLFYKQ